jgi:hypothetical protein
MRDGHPAETGSTGGNNRGSYASPAGLTAGHHHDYDIGRDWQTPSIDGSLSRKS